MIQCLNQDDLEATMDTLKAGFVTEDHRIYQDISFSDDVCFYRVNAKTFKDLFELQQQIRMMSDGRLETSFTDLVTHAKELEKCFKKALKTVTTHPIEYKEK